MKNTIVRSTITVIALASSAFAVEESKLNLKPFAQVEAVYAQPGLETTAAPKLNKFSLGVGFTAGVYLNEVHEISVSTGFNSWEQAPVVTPGFASAEVEQEQIPVMLNYRYHAAVFGGKGTVFAGPSVGAVIETTSVIAKDLGGLPPAMTGTEEDTRVAFAYGFTIGTKYEFAKNWFLTASASVSKIEGKPDVKAPGSPVGPATKRKVAPAFTLGVNYSW